MTGLKFPRHTPRHGDDWVIDPAFLQRVLHSIEPGHPYEFTPSLEQVEVTLLALEVIPNSLYTTSPSPTRKPWVRLNAKDLAEIPLSCFEGAIWADAKLWEKNT